MKTLNIAIILAIATFASACGLIEKGPDFTGMYQGQATYSFIEDFGEFGAYEDNGVWTDSITVSRADDGSLLIDGLDEGCVVRGTEQGDYFELNSLCVYEQDGLHTSMLWTGDGEFTESGKLRIDANAEIHTSEKVHYQHGFEWEEFGVGTMVVSFSGRPI